MKRFGSFKTYLVLALLTIALAFLTAPAEASLVNYQFSGVGASFDIDSLGEIDDVDFKVSLVGDTNNKVFFTFTDSNNVLQSGWALEAISGTIQLFNDITNNSSNFFTKAFADPVEVFVNNSSTQVGFTNTIDDSLFSLFNLSSGLLGTYSLSAPFGPLAADALLFTNFDVLFTDGDFLTFVDTIPFGEAHFSAAPVPVPAPVLLLASGLVGLVVARRRVKK